MKRYILVTGVAGSGKTSVSEELNKLGYTAFDIENTGSLFRLIYKNSGLPATRNLNDDLAEMRKCELVCDKPKLQKLMDSVKADISFYCGFAHNLQELLPLFDRILLLQPDNATILKRLSSRKTGQFGNKPDMQQWVLGWRNDWENRLIDQGAIIVNANLPLNVVTRQVAEKSLS